MKKLSVFLLLCFVSLSVFAYSENNKVYFGIEGGTYSYREPHMDLPISLKGNKIGASIEWVGRHILESNGWSDSQDKSFATFELRYMTGKVDYNGYLWSGEPHKSKGEEDWYIESRMTLGQTYQFMDVGEIWPYFGFGFRYLVNNGEKVDPSAYKRISKYCYIPIGFRLIKDSESGIKLALITEFDWLIFGEQKSRLFTDGSYVTNDQKKGWGARISLKAEFPTTKKVGIFVEPYFRMWKIQNSDWYYVYVWDGYGWQEIPFGREPFNVTKEFGIKAGIYF